MRILLIGGNGFIGRFVAAELIQQRHAVAVFHRGTTAAPAGVEELRGNRNQLTASAQQLKRFAPDVVIDLVFSSGPQAEELMNIFRGRNPTRGHAEQHRCVPRGGHLARHGKWAAAGSAPYYDKTPAERVVMNDPELPGTVLRLPMPYHPAPPLHRFYPVVKRITDRRRQLIFPETLAAWRLPRATSRTWPRPFRWLPQMNTQRDVSTTCARSHRSANWNGRVRSPPRCGGMGTRDGISLH